MKRIALLSMVVGLAAILTVARLDARASAPPSRPMTFVDERAGSALTLQTEPLARDAGAFAFRVTGRGVYVGRADSALDVRSDHSFSIHFEGPALLRPIQRLDGGFDSPDFAPRTVQIRLQAHVDPALRIAEATLVDGTERFHLVSPRVGRGEVLRVAEAYETATLAQDWRSLYALVNSDLLAAYTFDEFAAQGAAEVARVGSVTRLTRVSMGDVTTTDAGATYVAVGYEMDIRQPAGSVVTSRFDVYFIRQLDAWKVWASVPR